MTSTHTKAAKRRKNKTQGRKPWGWIPLNQTAPEGRKRVAHTAANVLSHFIFSTHHREPLINSEMQSDPHAYLGGIIREIGGVALCINGMADHVHLLVRMPSTHSVADVARLIKTNSSRWAHDRGPQFKNFAWQAGYGAFSVSESGIDAVRAYIQKQQQPHARRSFHDELVAFLEKNHIAVDEKYLWARDFLRPFGACYFCTCLPRAYALGSILAPLRGFPAILESLRLQHDVQILRMNRPCHGIFTGELLLKHQLRQRLFQCE